ncbi:DUF1610 domain-containing protein [Candidatus Woesearchaeota archaeon]|nr:DUF1610 domain-containing protein [Candidatus Woesearchaeota archaeon]
MKEEKCISCNIRILNQKGTVKFRCPQCGQFDIIRCPSCRKSAIKYKCPNCSFVGPN